ncbi:MAG: hypothetical protein EPO40_18695 [Myxococcaceae bacterium]|nr:MAG: hypothetical protein EPO40_18695 [Myxococcaceae bacterium]
MSYSLHDPWKRKLFVAVCRRYGLAPYREPGQRRSTVLVLAPRRFHDKTLWPEYLALSAELEKHLADLTERVIREAIHDDVIRDNEANEDEPKDSPSPARERSSGRDGCPRGVALRCDRWTNPKLAATI